MVESYEQIPNGCRHHCDCFSCPYDDCINGELTTLKRALYRELRERALQMRAQGKKAPSVAKELEIPKITVYRWYRAVA